MLRYLLCSSRSDFFESQSAPCRRYLINWRMGRGKFIILWLHRCINYFPGFFTYHLVVLLPIETVHRTSIHFMVPMWHMINMRIIVKHTTLFLSLVVVGFLTYFKSTVYCNKNDFEEFFLSWNTCKYSAETMQAWVRSKKRKNICFSALNESPIRDCKEVALFCFVFWYIFLNLVTQ